MKRLLSDFVYTGALDVVRLGATKGSIETILGPAEELGLTEQTIRIHAYADRRLQLSYRSDQVVLIAVYLPLHASGSVQIGRIEVVDDLPEDVREDISSYIAWLGGQPWVQSWDAVSGIVRPTAKGVSAVFDDRGLSSLQLS